MSLISQLSYAIVEKMITGPPEEETIAPEYQLWLCDSSEPVVILGIRRLFQMTPI